MVPPSDQIYDLTAAGLTAPVYTRAQLCEVLGRRTRAEVWDLQREGRYILKQKTDEQQTDDQVVPITNVDVARKFTTLIGDGVATNFYIPHLLGTLNVVVTFYDCGTGNQHYLPYRVIGRDVIVVMQQPEVRVERRRARIGRWGFRFGKPRKVLVEPRPLRGNSMRVTVRHE